MGVMECDRVGCSHVMCSILIKVGYHEEYICGSCYAELKSFLCAVIEPNTDKPGLRKAVEIFMDSMPGSTEENLRLRLRREHLKEMRTSLLGRRSSFDAQCISYLESITEVDS